MAATRSLARIAVNAAWDFALAALAVPLAGWIAAPNLHTLPPPWAMPLSAALLLAAGVPFRLSRQHWRFAGLGDLAAVAGSAALGVVLLAALVLPFVSLSPNPAFPVALALVQTVLLAAPRVAYRHARNRPRIDPDQAAEPSLALLAGAGEDADLFLHALAQDRRQNLRVIGLLGFGSRQTGRRIMGQPILGSVSDAGAVLDRLAAEGRLPRMLVVVSASIPGPALAGLVEQADRYGLLVRRAPQLTALDPATVAATGAAAAATPGRRTPLELRPVEIDDLLNRAQVPLDRDAMARLVQGRRVIVTGAGGTIGSELARQIAALGPERLILLDNGEYALWQIDLELGERHPGVTRKALIADVRDAARIRAIFADARPDLVFHAAALKHVPMVEANPAEGLLSNAAGTRHVADAARAAGARAMVLISTDKAVNPTSVMGASKRLAEMYCQALDLESGGDDSRMRCITVRFGNVLGSTGSVVPLFQRQLARGGPLTVTHPDMRRYFMTVREAVGLVLQATVVRLTGAPLPSGEQGGIFVLDMGEPVKIADLARQMIRLAGLRPDEDVAIQVTGLRPGEKLYEELFHGQEPPVPTGYPGLLMAAPRTADPAIVGRAMDDIAGACRGGHTRLALEQLGRLIPEFAHNADGQTPGQAQVTGTP
ncbi:MAG: polysaccharide biosynthesis protein [Rhodospirillales bacterium]|nr:polysaccharide biosynthesis protein [Rhodospirillales bacterium]